MEHCDENISGRSHGRPLVTAVQVDLKSNDFENFIYNVLENPSEPDPYDSDKDQEYRIDSKHDSESE